MQTTAIPSMDRRSFKGYGGMYFLGLHTYNHDYKNAWTLQLYSDD